MQKPKAAKRIFLAHFLHGQLAVSEKRSDARGTHSFDVVLLRGHDRSITFQAPDLDASDTARFHAMMDRIEHLAAAQRKAGPFDALQLAQAAPDQLDLSQILSIKLMADYTSAALVYASAMADYLAKPVGSRFQHSISLDLYRQALGFHDVPSMMRLVTEDGPSIPPFGLNQHARETTFDALFHMARRIGQRAPAFQFLSKSWAAKHTVGRGHILIDEAAFRKESALIVQIAAFLDAQGQLAARHMAQLAVAQQRLGKPDAALATFQRLSAVKGDDAQDLARKIAAFLDAAQK